MERGRSLICVSVVLFGIVAYSLIPEPPKEERFRREPEWVKSCKGRLLESHGGAVGYLYRTIRLVQDMGNSVVNIVGWAVGYDFKIFFGCPADDKMMGSVSKLVDKIGLEKLEAMVMQSLNKQPRGIHKSDSIVS